MAAIIGLALAAGLALQPDAHAEDERVVRVYATALDERGRPVNDLAAGEFTVTQDGVERAVGGATFVTTPGPAAAPGDSPGVIVSRLDERVEAAREGARLFAFFLDEYHVAPGRAADDVRAALGRFVEEHLGPRDLFVVFRPLDSLLNIRLTRDRAAAIDAIGRFAGRKGMYEPRNAFERDFLAADPRPNDRGRAQISMAALQALATHLGRLEAGRKALVVVSEGITGGEGDARVEATSRIAHRGGVAIYPIDPRRDEDVASDDEPRRRLASLAEATGGRATRGADRADAGLRQLDNDQGGYYILTFRSRTATDGGVHPARVGTVRPGVEIRSSRAHWTGAPTEADDTGLARVAATTSSLRVRRLSTLIRPWFGVADAGGGRSRVSFVWEPARPTPGAPGPGRVPARIALRVSSDDGAELFDGIVAPVGRGSREASRAVFLAPHGRLRVEMRIEDDRAEYLDVDMRDVDAGPWDGPIALGTVQMFRTRSALEYRAIAGDAEAVPVASREFLRAERLIIRVPVSSGSGAPAVTAALTTGFGHVVRTLAAAAGPSAEVHQLDLPLAGLVAGEYRLEITAATGDAAVREVVGFRVLP